MKAYYFFEDSHREHATAHDARCGHCRRGIERQVHSLTPNSFSYWHGPYETFAQATAEAERMGLPVVACTSCLEQA